MGSPKKATPSRKKIADSAADKRVALRRKPARPAASRPIEPSFEVVPPPGEEVIVKTHLSAAELEEFREILLIKRAQLVGDIATLNSLQKNRQESSGDLSSVPFHPADAGSDNFEQEFTIGLMGNEQSLLREIDEALDRIVKGNYGICVATNKPITKARLQAKPWAKHCIEHARTLEKGPIRRI
jgi:RNA polymerase-binding protein DksA